MENSIRVPIESIRCAVEGATFEMFEAQKDGRHATARSIQKSINEATDKTQRNESNSVSIEATHAATLVAQGYCSKVPDSHEKVGVIHQTLEESGHW